MDSACTQASVLRFGIDEQIDVIAQRGALGREAYTFALLGAFGEAHDIEDGGGLFRLLEEERDAIKAAYRMFHRNRCVAWSMRGFCVRMTDDLDLHAIGIGKGQHGLVKASATFNREMVAGETLRPEVDRG